MRTVRLAVLFVIVSAATASQVCAEDKTSATDARLKKWLEQFPQADADKDGVLTESEVQAYRDKVLTERKKQGRAAAPLPAPAQANVHYGPHERQVLDFYRADSDRPSPVIVYIHGGGFVAGDKRTLNADFAAQCLKSGISVAAINYRFVTTNPFAAPQQDGARAIQFLRSQATSWNIDPQKIAAFGGSAGAGISLWLAFHDDLADPKSDDPVARQSSRLVAAGSLGGQTTYDPHVIKEWIGGRAHEHPSIYKCYNVATLAELDDPKLQPLYDEVSAIKHLTPDDPPVIMLYNEADGPLPADAKPGQGIHHPTFGRKLKAAMEELKIPVEFYYLEQPEGGIVPGMLRFFQQQFEKSKG